MSTLFILYATNISPSLTPTCHTARDTHRTIWELPSEQPEQEPAKKFGHVTNVSIPPCSSDDDKDCCVYVTYETCDNNEEKDLLLKKWNDLVIGGETIVAQLHHNDETNKTGLKQAIVIVENLLTEDDFV